MRVFIFSLFFIPLFCWADMTIFKSIMLGNHPAIAAYSYSFAEHGKGGCLTGNKADFEIYNQLQNYLLSHGKLEDKQLRFVACSVGIVSQHFDYSHLKNLYPKKSTEILRHVFRAAQQKKHYFIVKSGVITAASSILELDVNLLAQEDRPPGITRQWNKPK